MQVCVDYDSYLKIVPKSKEKGLKCLGSSSSTHPQYNNTFWDLIWFLSQECVIGQCAWARAQGMSSVLLLSLIVDSNVKFRWVVVITLQEHKRSKIIYNMVSSTTFSRNWVSTESSRFLYMVIQCIRQSWIHLQWPCRQSMHFHVITIYIWIPSWIASSVFCYNALKLQFLDG